MDRMVLRLDLYPARVTIASSSYSNLRALITYDGKLIAYRLGPNGPEVQFEWAITGEITGAPSYGYDVPTESGVVTVENGGGCGGCGSQLGQADLFPGVQRVLVGMGQ